jgi:hypothetical protein
MIIFTKIIIFVISYKQLFLIKMKNIGFLFGNEKKFSQQVINKINEENSSNIIAEPITIGIVNNFNSIKDYKYDVIFDRFSNAVPFYHSVMKFLTANGIRVVVSSYSHLIEEELTTLSQLKVHKVNVPSTAIVPSKNLPQGIQGIDMQNLQYPLDWDNMFNDIGFPANVKSNNSNDLFDTYRIYSKEDFFFIYDMSGTKTLLYQECIDAQQNIRVFVVGKNKTHLNYELHKAPKDRYSIFTENIDTKIEKNIDDIIKTIRSLLKLDMFIIDVAIDVKDKLYLLNISLFSMNIDNAHFPTETYNWLVDSTADMLIGISEQITKEKAAVIKKETKTTKDQKNATTPNNRPRSAKRVVISNPK